MVRIACWLLAVVVSLPASAETVSIAVCSNFREAMEQLATRFEQESGHVVQLSPASSGKHYAQILHGAPFQVFLSADAERPELLEQGGHAVPGTRFVYARGRLTLWGPHAGDADCRQQLESGGFRRLAIANARTAPYGVAAEQVLDALELDNVYRDRTAIGDNVSQAMQFADSGAADAAFIATSLWQLHPRRLQGCHWEVPAELIAPLDQEAILLQRGASSPAARALLDFLRTPAARRTIAAAGYDLPD